MDDSMDRCQSMLSQTSITAVSRAMRKPQRLTITVPWQLHQDLIQQSHQQGRSVSNLACFWLEQQANSQPRSH